MEGTAHTDGGEAWKRTGDGEAAPSLATAGSCQCHPRGTGDAGRKVLLLEASARQGWTVVIRGDAAAVKHTPNTDREDWKHPGFCVLSILKSPFIAPTGRN